MVLRLRQERKDNGSSFNKEMEVEMLELTSGEWEWVVAALEHFQNDPLLSWDEGERAELNALFHKIKDGDV